MVLGGSVLRVKQAAVDELVRLRRSRDYVDRHFAEPLSVATIAEAAFMSPSHFSRRFRDAYGESPYEYLMTRRIERAMAMLREGRRVSDTCVAVGWPSLGSFSTRFHEIVGESPSSYRNRDHAIFGIIPPCLSRTLTRPRR